MKASLVFSRLNYTFRVMYEKLKSIEWRVMLQKVLPIFVVLGTLTAQAQEKFSLQRAVDFALQNNLNLKELKLNRALDDDLITQSKVNLLPTLNGSLQDDRSFGRTINPTTNSYTNNTSSYYQGQLNSQWVLFQGFQKLNTIRQYKYQLLSDQSALEKGKNDLMLNVVTYYIAMLSYQDLIVSSKDKLAVSKQTLEFDQKKLNAGTITEADYLNDLASYDQDAQSVTTYQNELDIARTNLATLLNIDPGKPLEIIRPDSINVNKLKTEYDPLTVFQKASQSLPDLKVAEFTSLVIKKELEVAKGGLFPILTLGGSYQTVYSPSYTEISNPVLTGQNQQTGLFTQNTKEPVVSPITSFTTTIIPFKDQIKNNITKSLYLSLSIPIFNGWQQHIAVKRAKFQYQKSILDKEIAKSTLNKTVVQAILDLRSAEKSYYASKSASEASKKAFYFSKVRYSVGLLNSLEYNLSKSKYAIAEATEIQNKYNYLFKAKVIDFYLGIPISL